MAFNKVVNRETMSRQALKKVLAYVMNDKKVRDGYVLITGPYPHSQIEPLAVYNTWLFEKQIWGKASKRLYIHNIISFSKNEMVTAAEVLEIAMEFVKRFFPNHQTLITVHQDKDHLHAHIITNTVSYVNGRKYHQNKHDLAFQKVFTNRLCLERGLTVNHKGYHFDGTPIEEGHIRAWNKNKYNFLKNNPKENYLVQCAEAVKAVMLHAVNREEFASGMEDYGWKVRWNCEKKKIVFQNENGKKVSNVNLAQTFSMNTSFDALEREFEKRQQMRNEGFVSKWEKEQQQLDAYYKEVESLEFAEEYEEKEER